MKRKTELKNPLNLISAVWLCAEVLAFTSHAVLATELRAHLEGSNLVMSWPTNTSDDFYVETTTNPTDLAGWTIVTNAASQLDGLYFVTNSPADSARFYRLRAWEVLFNGSSTSALRGYRSTSFPGSEWTITANGELKTVSGSPQGHIITTNQFTDFELVWEWKTGAGGNSGVIYRVTEFYDAAWKSGPEYQLIDDSGYALPTDQSSGAVWGLIPPTTGPLLAAGQWNQCRLLVQSNHVEHWLNGRLRVSYELNSSAFGLLVAGSPSFSPYAQFAKARTGYIAFQNWTPEVWFRNIKIRRVLPR
ncbi:MAG TPA: DUF1080 domain-containing protein [Candidatus Limnocylindrales bacterium]|jgi:hypothetical protein|nr:DUF1080 domain-containing protein [Candidatus Limnocylindrales bacterium]